MPLLAELELADGSAAPRCIVGQRATVIGRSAACDYVVDRATVSREHAALWTENGTVHVRDLRSRNGTFVNETRIDTATLSEGDLLRIGTEVVFRVRLRMGSPQAAGRRLALEDVHAGLRFLLDTEPVRLGTGDDVHVRLNVEGHVDAIVTSPRQGEAWLGHDDDMVELTLGQTFELAGRAFRLVEVEADPGATAAAAAMPWPYAVDAAVDGDRVRAVVSDANGGRKHELAGTNRAVLLYLLARQWRKDDALDPEERGWSDDEDLAIGVWGREGRGRSLKVLVCRLRSELREAGFDPWFIEKRRGGLRIRVRDAKVD